MLAPTAGSRGGEQHRDRGACGEGLRLCHRCAAGAGVEPAAAGGREADTRADRGRYQVYRVRFGRGVGVGVAIIENTGFDRPRSWSAGSTSRRLDVRFQGQVTEVPGGCQLAVRNELFPHGVPRALSPFLRLLIRRSWEQDLRAIKTMADVGGPDDGDGSEQRDERAVRRSRPALWTSGADVGAALIRRPRSVRPRRGCSFLLRAHRARAAWQAPASVPWPGQV